MAYACLRIVRARFRTIFRFGVNAETFAHHLEKIGVLAPSLRKRFKKELLNYYEERRNAGTTYRDAQGRLKGTKK